MLLPALRLARYRSTDFLLNSGGGKSTEKSSTGGQLSFRPPAHFCRRVEGVESLGSSMPVLLYMLVFRSRGSVRSDVGLFGTSQGGQ